MNVYVISDHLLVNHYDFHFIVLRILCCYSTFSTIHEYNFIDYKQVFDTVWHEGLSQAMRNLRIEEKNYKSNKK